MGSKGSKSSSSLTLPAAGSSGARRRLAVTNESSSASANNNNDGVITRCSQPSEVTVPLRAEAPERSSRHEHISIHPVLLDPAMLRNEERIDGCVAKLVNAVSRGDYVLLESRLVKYINRYTSWTLVLRTTGEDVLKQKTKRPDHVDYHRFVDARGEHGRTLVYIAASGGFHRCIVTLIKMGADITLCDDFGVSPLYIAASKGHLTCVELLLKNGAPINVHSASGWHLFHRCIRGGKLDCLGVLLSYAASRASTGGEICSLEVLDDSGQKPIHFAAGKYANVECLKLLLSHGCDIDSTNNKGQTALHIASGKYGRLDIVCFLLDNGAALQKRSTDGPKALHLAILYNRLEICELIFAFALKQSKNEHLLEENGSDISDCEESTSKAAGYRDIRELGQGVFELNFSETEGCEFLRPFGSASSIPPLVHSDEQTERPIVEEEWHIPRKLNVKARPYSGILPGSEDELHERAHVRRSSSAFEKLCGTLESRTLCPDSGMTPLMYAVSLGHVDIAKFLLKKGAKVNAVFIQMQGQTKQRGKSVLAYACLIANPELVALLLDYGADPNLKDSISKTYPIETLLASCKRVHQTRTNRQTPTASNHISEKDICECLDLLLEGGGIIRGGLLDDMIQNAKRSACKRVAKHLKKILRTSRCTIPTLTALCRSKMKQAYGISLLSLKEMQDNLQAKQIPNSLVTFLSRPSGLK